MQVEQFIDSIKYGFPTQENAQFLDDKTIYDKYFSEFTKTPFNPNSSGETFKELLVVSEALNDGKDKKAHLVIDRDFYGYLISQVKKQGIILSVETLQKIILNVAPLIMRLKVHYQRPRPFQLGIYANVPLFPHSSNGAQAPAYPSGHACQSRYMALILAYLFPDKEDFLIQLSDYVANSRVSIGVHFPSDNAFGQAIAEYLFNKPETKEFIDSIANEIITN